MLASNQDGMVKVWRKVDGTNVSVLLCPQCGKGVCCLLVKYVSTWAAHMERSFDDF